MMICLNRFLKLWKRIRNRYLTLFEGVKSPEMRYEVIAKNSETFWNHRKQIWKILKQIGIAFSRFENGQKTCKNGWKRWKTMRKQLKSNLKFVRTLRRVPTFCKRTNWTLVDTMWTAVGRGRAILSGEFDVESGGYVDIDFEAKLDFAPWLGLMKLGWGSVWVAVAARHLFSKFAPRCFYCTLQCPRNVVERNLSFPTRILSFSKSSGVARTSTLPVFAQFGGRRRVSAVRFGGIFGSFLGL